MNKRKTQQKIIELEKQVVIDQLIIEAWKRSSLCWQSLAEQYKAQRNA
jgi:hypothetical protein